jgi:hypothetical protein
MFKVVLFGNKKVDNLKLKHTCCIINKTKIESLGHLLRKITINHVVNNFIFTFSF